MNSDTASIAEEVSQINSSMPTNTPLTVGNGDVKWIIFNTGYTDRLSTVSLDEYFGRSDLTIVGCDEAAAVINKVGLGHYGSIVASREPSPLTLRRLDKYIRLVSRLDHCVNVNIGALTDTRQVSDAIYLEFDTESG